MFKIKNIFFAVFFIFCCLTQSVFADIRDYVGYIAGEYSEEDVKFLDASSKDGSSITTSLTESDMTKRIFLNNNFNGTGVVYVAEDGTNYFITSTNGIKYYKNFSVSFTNIKNKEKKVYNGLTVVNYSKELGIAILAFPKDQKPFKEGVSFCKNSVEDGESISGVAFKDEGKTPVWYYVNVNVTNKAAFINKIVDENLSSLITYSDDGRCPLLLLKKIIQKQVIV